MDMSKNKKVSFSEHVTMCDSMDRKQKKHEPHPSHAGQVLLQNAWEHLPKQALNNGNVYRSFQREPPSSKQSGQWNITKTNLDAHNQRNTITHSSLPKGLYSNPLILDGLTSWYNNAKNRQQVDETCSEDGSTTTSGSYVMNVDEITGATVV